MKISIEWLLDEYECEDCGGSQATGARVWFDDDPVLELEPSAHCCGGATYTEAEVYQEILKLLGHEVKETESDF